MAKKKKKDSQRYREIRNAKVFRDYFIEESFEAGMMLTGTEVKSLREGQGQINDAFVRIDNNLRIPILYNAHISEYSFGNYANHKPLRPRRLLLNKREIHKIEQMIQSGGRTIVPVKLYFKQALVKIEIAVCQGKKMYDKRDDLKKKVELREADRAMKNRSLR